MKINQPRTDIRPSDRCFVVQCDLKVRWETFSAVVSIRYHSKFSKLLYCLIRDGIRAGFMFQKYQMSNTCNANIITLVAVQEKNSYIILLVKFPNKNKCIF